MNPLRSRTNHPSRAGITLLELVIVLALLIVLAAVAMPSFVGMLRRQRLVSAAESVRTEWMRAHIHAMKTGRVHVYRFQTGDRKFEIIPWVAEDDALESSVNADQQGMVFAMSTAAGTSAGGVDMNDGPGLPEGVLFVAGDAQADNRAMTIEDALMGAAGADGQWSRPILFYPDGTASEAYIIVANDQQEAIRIELRGLTGMASVSDISLLEEMVQ